MNKKLTAGELFAGIGGFSAGLTKAGIRVSWAIENDKYAVRTFHSAHPNVQLKETDIRKINADELSQVDILTAGFPCQSFTAAGKTEGFSDERGKLFYEIVRLVNEFGKRKPKVIIMENVPNLMEGDNGRWIAEIIKQISGAGYWFSKLNCQLINTAEMTSIPQMRERLIMVAVSRDHFANNQFIFPYRNMPIQSLDNFINRTHKAKDKYYLDPENHYTKMFLEHTKNKSKDSIFMMHRKNQIREFGKSCPVLRATMRPSGSTLPIIYDKFGIRCLTPYEAYRLQGFDAIYFDPTMSDLQVFKQIGNAVSPKLVFQFAAAITEFINKDTPENTDASKYKCTACAQTFPQGHIDKGYYPRYTQKDMFTGGAVTHYQLVRKCNCCKQRWHEECFPQGNWSHTWCDPCSIVDQKKHDDFIEKATALGAFDYLNQDKN